MNPRPVVAVVGPTAAGKTALSLALAHLLDGEVVNADSMQLYRGMDIGTAKLRPHERRGRRPPRAGPVGGHRAGQRGRVPAGGPGGGRRHAAPAAVPPLLVGGSGLYVRAVLEQFEFPGTDAGLRARLEAELAEVGPAPLHARLARHDPSRGRADPAQQRPADRAGAGGHRADRGPFEASLPDPTPYYPAVHIGVDRDPAVLDERIATRVRPDVAAGLLDEVRELEQPRAAARPHGQPGAGLPAGAASPGRRVLDWSEARAETVRATRRFVRRQRTWFRRDPRIVWLDGAAPDLIARALAAVGAR